MSDFTLPLPIDTVYSDYGTRKKRQLLDLLYNQCYNKFTAMLRDPAFGSVKDTDGTDLDPTGKNERAEYFINNYLQYIMDRATFAIRLEVHKKNASFHHELASLVREFKKLLEYTDSLYNVVYGEAAELGIFKTVIRYFMEQNNFCV